MANTPKVVRKDAKLLAKKRRESGDKPFAANTKAKLNPFKEADVKNMAYLTDYSVKHSNAPKRSKEFHAARSGKTQEAHIAMIRNMDQDYRDAKTWKKENPDYKYPGGTGDRK